MNRRNPLSETWVRVRSGNPGSILREEAGIILRVNSQASEKSLIRSDKNKVLVWFMLMLVCNLGLATPEIVEFSLAFGY